MTMGPKFLTQDSDRSFDDLGIFIEYTMRIVMVKYPSGWSTWRVTRGGGTRSGAQLRSAVTRRFSLLPFLLGMFSYLKSMAPTGPDF